MINISNKKNRGFTIVETMISVALFTIITTLGMGTLLNAHLVYKKSQDMRAIIDSLNFVMEDISRNVRTGYNYHCFTGADTILSTTQSTYSDPKNCASGWGLAFEYAYGDSNPLDDLPSPGDIAYNDQWIYYIGSSGNDTGKLFKSTAGPYGTSSFTQLTPDEVVIDPASTASFFIVEGADNSDTLQPIVTIRLSGTITYKGVVSPFTIQTKMSQRILDI